MADKTTDTGPKALDRKMDPDAFMVGMERETWCQVSLFINYR